jgi:hypothetical protein
MRIRSYLMPAADPPSTLRHEWIEGQLFWLYQLPENLVLEELPWAPCTNSAIVGLTAAIVEWPLTWLARFDADPIPGFALEAAWCANIDRRYSRPLELSESKWRGPIRGPLFCGVSLVHEAIFECWDAGTRPLHTPLIATRLAEHICRTAVEPFRIWRAEALARLKNLFTAPPPLEDLYGERANELVVSPTVFDPSNSIDPGDLKKLADSFLRSVDPAPNPFLVSPDWLLKHGFSGDPYRLTQS